VRRLALALAAIALAGAGLRVAAALATFPSTPLGDENYYIETATRIARGEGHVYGRYDMRARWPPGQSWLLSRAVDTRLLESTPELLAELARREPAEMEARHRAFLAPLVATAVAVGCLLVPLTAWLAALLFDTRTALVAAVLVAIDPTLVAASHTLWSENLFTVLLTAALGAAAAAWRRPGAVASAATGALFGLAALTREIALPMAAVVALWWWLAARRRDRRRVLLLCALMLASTAAVVVPWTWRNVALFGRVVPVSTVGWMGMREGNTLSAERFFDRDWPEIRAFRRRYVATADEMERMDVARREAIALVRDAQPAWIVRKLGINLGELFGPGSAVFTKIRQGTYGEVSPLAARAILLATVGLYLLVVAAAALGIAAAPRDGRRALPLLLLAALLAIHVAANAFPKYRVPLVPLFVTYAAWGLLEGARRPLGRAWLAPAAALLAVSLLGGPRFGGTLLRLWSYGSEPATAPRAQAKRIVLVSMDTVRADRVSGYAAGDPTPRIARIAEQGVLFRDFYAASNYTIPSHMSLFTGLDPAEHGVTVAGARLSPRVATLAERLSRSGFVTAAFHEGGFVGERFGFGRGFGSYRRVPRVGVVREALPSILEWIREHRSERWFLFVHSYAAHFPYGGFERYRRAHPERELPGDGELAALRRRWPGNQPLGPRAARSVPPATRSLCTLYNHLAPSHAQHLACGGYLFSEADRAGPHFGDDLAAVRRSYQERIRLVDAAIGRIRETLDDLGQWDDTLFVVTSDHGEAFYEHDLVRHDFVPFEEVMRVPLIVSFPRKLGSEGRVVGGLAWHLDLLPTILSLAGLPVPPGLRGIDLTPALLGEEGLPEGRAVFPQVLRPIHRDPEPPRRVALRGGWKLVEGHPEFGDEAGLLFDLRADPLERHNLRSERPERAAALAALARSWDEGLERVPPVSQRTGLPLSAGEAPVPVPPDEDVREQLRALGYVDEDRATSPP
jgi:arylsulfatase A-like enzyme